MLSLSGLGQNPMLPFASFIPFLFRVTKKQCKKVAAHPDVRVFLPVIEKNKPQNTAQ